GSYVVGGVCSSRTLIVIVWRVAVSGWWLVVGRGGPMKVDNRWFQLGAAVVAMVMIANLQYAWTLFVKPLQQGTGWKVSDIQWAFTLFILFQTWVQPAQGWLIDRMGPRLFATIAGVLCGIGWAGPGFVTSLPMLYTL